MLARRAQWALVPFQKFFQKLSLKELCFSITHAYVSFTSCGTLLKIFTGHPFIFCCSTYCLPTATKIYLYTFSLLSLTMPFPINMRIVLVNDIDQSKWSCSSVIGIRHTCTCWKPSPVLLVYVLCIMVAAWWLAAGRLFTASIEGSCVVVLYSLIWLFIFFIDHSQISKLNEHHIKNKKKKQKTQ